MLNVIGHATGRTRQVVVSGLFAVVLCAPFEASAETASIVASKDNSVFSNNVNNSDGGGAGIFSGTTGLGTPCRGLIDFDVARNVPAGSIITGVELRLYLGMAPNTNPQNIELHKLTKDWGEGTAGSSNPAIMMSGMGYPAGEGDATWNDAMFASVSWSNPGATGDFNQAASASTTVSGPIDTTFTWGSTSAMVADVQSWLDAPGSDFGWALINTDEATSRTQKVFYSRQATQNSSGIPDSLDPSWRPTLTISYTNSMIIAGDYNHDGLVNTADFVVWRNTLGQSVSPSGRGADGNQNGTIDAGDYNFWRARFGNAMGGIGSGTLVPEPTYAAYLLATVSLAYLRRQR
jgi:hypothetical protein